MDEKVYPDFKGSSLLSIPSSILKFFGVKPLKQALPEEFVKNLEGADKVILFLIDGFGDKLYQEEGLKYKFFRTLFEKGFYSKITTVFPSTTAAALSTINSGLSPLEHGLPEWNVYFRELDSVVQTLPFIPVIPGDQERLKNPPEGLLYNKKTIYQHLKEVGVPSYMLLYEGYIQGIYNQTSSVGSQMIGYKKIEDFVNTLFNLLVKIPKKAFIYAYWPGVDSAEHVYGPNSKETKEEITHLAVMLEELIEKMDTNLSEKVGVILTADHGQVPVDSKKAKYIDEIDGLIQCFKLSPVGRLIPPSGSARDVFLNIIEEKMEFAIDLLKTELKDFADVVKTEDFIEKGVFGYGEMHPEFLSRVGNLLVLPKGYNTLWYHFTPDTRVNFSGLHGGLSGEEMYIPFACAKLSQLKD